LTRDAYPGLALDRETLDGREDARDALLDAALGQAQAGRLDAAMCGLTLVIDVDRSSDVAWNARGYIRWQKGHHAEALSDFNEAVRLDPDDATYYANRAGVLLDMQQYERAWADYDGALRLDPKLAIALNGRGVIGFLANRDDAAIEDYTAALDVNPDYLLAYRNRAWAYLSKGDCARAVKDFDRIISAGAAGATEFALRGSCHGALGNLQTAAADFDAALRIDPQNKIALAGQEKISVMKRPPLQ